MYKRLILSTLLITSLYCSEAQMSISLREPPSGLIQKQQLWNLSLIYTGNSPINVTIGLSLTDINDNQPLLTAVTKPFAVAKGVKLIKPSDINPVNYNYFSTAFGRFSESLIPIGNYRACYTVYTGINEAQIILAEDCIPLEVSPLSPPQLSTPADTATIQQRYPQFSWLPPAPVSLFSDLNYDIIVTEVRPDQTPGSAIQVNLPVYFTRRLTSVFNNYPSSSKALDTGRVYAWRIIAKNGEVPSAFSEVWTFKIAPDKISKPNKELSAFIELKNNDRVERTAIVTDRNLGVKFYSYEKTHEGIVRFLNEKGEVVKEYKRMFDYGNNFWVFNLEEAFQQESTYIIEVLDSQLNRYSTSFRLEK